MSKLPFTPFSSRTLPDVNETLRQWIIAIRRHIHQYPELAFEEYRTAAFIREKLAEHGIGSIGGVGGTGVVATLGPVGNTIPCVALRVDMDALPVVEETGLPFSSSYPGIMHACGHDGHIAMLLGAAVLLNRAEQLPGCVKLVFQPAEEHGNGASKMVQEGVVDDVGAIFTGHIDTHYRTGQITVDQGLICAYSDPFHIKIRGSSGHAARPHESKDAVVAASSLVMNIQTLVSREVDPSKAEVITIGSFQAGTVSNVIAGEALLKGTIRSTDETVRLQTITGLKRIVHSIAAMYDVHVEIVFEESLPAVINARRAAEIARIAAWDITTVDHVLSQSYPSLGGEDFSFYLQKVEGCMVRFGAAPSTQAGTAHSTTFDFDENCLEFGSRWMATVAWRWLEQAVLLVENP